MNPSNTLNIETSLNAWLDTQLDTYTPPAFFSGFPGARLVAIKPESPLNPPLFSVSHIFIEMVDEWQGRRGADNSYAQCYYAFMDVQVWVVRSNVNWMAEKRWLCAVLADIVNKTPSVQLTDYLTNYPASSSVDRRIYIGNLEARQTEQDVNPDFERERFLIKYHHYLRSNRT